ncbi:MAG: endonuclease domain-containing protein [Oscillospiraceae bacterium]|nr:endonuclease domain-containing protein [Oscillospiraceae bacterium]
MPMGKLLSNARNLRRNMTKEERHLWYDYLKDYPEHIYRQRIVGGYIVDFYCASAQLVIELDGSQHYDGRKNTYDAERTKYLEGLGLAVLRIPNNEVFGNFDGVCEFIHRMIQRRIKNPEAGIDAIY